MEDYLLSRYPTMSADNIVGGWEGIKQQVGGKLERLKENGVKHIVVAFPQVIVTTRGGHVGLPNQVAKVVLSVLSQRQTEQ